MGLPRAGKVMLIGLVAVVLAGAGAAATWTPLADLPPMRHLWHRGQDAWEAPPPSMTAVPNKPHTVHVESELVVRLGIKTEPARLPENRKLDLSGSLALDSNRLFRIHVRFPGDVIEIGKPSASPSEDRPLRMGDPVKKGQLLCVIWSKDLGEKKSELVDNLSQLRLDQKALDGMRKAASAIPPVRLLEAERSVEQDLIAVARAERTLRAWHLSDEEINELKAEAEAIRQRGGKHDPEKEKNWPRVVIKAPFDGVVIERNVNQGDVVVDNTLDLFKIANVNKLTVWAHAYEEDLPALQALPHPVPWTVRIRADRNGTAMPGFIQTIGQVLDANQHTALVMGEVDNRTGKLRAGQFITATVELPPPTDTVAIPATALIEDGRDSIIFVQKGDGLEYTLRKVRVVTRLADTVLVSNQVGPEDAKQGIRPLKIGERVVREGAVELKAALEDLEAAAKEKR